MGIAMSSLGGEARPRKAMWATGRIALTATMKRGRLCPRRTAALGVSFIGAKRDEVG
jgi:hypothetical protein